MKKGKKISKLSVIEFLEYFNDRSYRKFVYDFTRQDWFDGCGTMRGMLTFTNMRYAFDANGMYMYNKNIESNIGYNQNDMGFYNMDHILVEETYIGAIFIIVCRRFGKSGEKLFERHEIVAYENK